MNTSNMMPPAYAIALEHSNTLRELGAIEVATPDGFTVVASYINNAKAVNAEALLKDTVLGAKLVIANKSMTPDSPVASAQGMAQVLSGIENLAVDTLTARCPGAPTSIIARTDDQALAAFLEQALEPQPAPNVNVVVQYSGAVGG